MPDCTQPLSVPSPPVAAQPAVRTTTDAAYTTHSVRVGVILAGDKRPGESTGRYVVSRPGVQDATGRADGSFLCVPREPVRTTEPDVIGPEATRDDCATQ
jgi:hypothetical protein